MPFYLTCQVAVLLAFGFHCLKEEISAVIVESREIVISEEASSMLKKVTLSAQVANLLTG